MVALFDFLPMFCPSCGGRLRVNESEFVEGRYTQSCHCGLLFQYGKEGNLLQAATASSGDLEITVNGNYKRQYVISRH